MVNKMPISSIKHSTSCMAMAIKSLTKPIGRMEVGWMLAVNNTGNQSSCCVSYSFITLFLFLFFIRFRHQKYIISYIKCKVHTLPKYFLSTVPSDPSLTWKFYMDLFTWLKETTDLYKHWFIFKNMTTTICLSWNVTR